MQLGKTLRKIYSRGSWKNIFCIATLFCLIQNHLVAQERFPTDAVSKPVIAENADSLFTKEQELDTATINYLTLENRQKIESEHDSLLNNNFQRYDPVFRGDFDYAHLGFPGTPARPIRIAPNTSVGLDVGFHAFDVYAVSHNTLRFYNQTKTFSDVYYSGSSQSNSVIEAKFARNFANDVHLTVDYRRVATYALTESDNPSVRNYLYVAPRGRTTSLGIGLWFKKERYEGYITYASHLVSEKDKGGIASDTAFNTLNTNGFTTVSNVNSNAETRYERYDYTYQHFFTLGKLDTTLLEPPHRRYRVAHTAQISATKNFSYDAFNSTDTTTLRQKRNFYGDLFTDTRGLQVAINTVKLSNTVWISTFKPTKHTLVVPKKRLNDSTTILKRLGVPDSVVKPQEIISRDSIAYKSDSLPKLLKDTATSEPKNNIEIGIMHEFWSVNNGGLVQHPQNFIGLARLRFAPTANITAEANGQLNLLGNNVGDYAITAYFSTAFPKIGALGVTFKNQLFSPTFLQNQLLVTGTTVWQNNFSKTLQTSIAGNLFIEALELNVQGLLSLTNNTIYFNAQAKPEQSGTPINLLQLSVKKDFRVGLLHLDNTLLFQKSSEFFVPVPTFYSKNSLYVEGRVFKHSLLIRTGFDLRVASAYYAPAYMPLINQFYVQQNGMTPATPVVDFFASAKVKSLRFFVKLENILGVFTNKVNYETYLYPTPDFSVQGAASTTFRFGLRWQLLN